MATRSLGQLTLDLVTNTGGWQRGMDASERRTQQWRRQVERDMRRVGRAAAASGAAAAAGLAVLTRQGLDFVDSQAKTAARLGSTIDDLRALQIAASDYGIEQGSLESSLASFTKRLGDAARGTGEAQQAFKALGLDAAELARMPLADQLALVADRISQVDSAAERTSIADRLMSGGRRMVNLFEEGGEAIREAVKEVDEFGLSLSQLDAKKVEDANDAIGRIPRLLEPIKTQLAISVAEPLEGISNHFLEAGKATRGFRDEISDMVDSVLGGLLFVIDAVAGVGRVFELAGAATALYAIEGERVMVNLAEAIYSGPVDAVNHLVEQLNRIPGIDLDSVEPPDIVNDLQERQALLEGAGAAARSDLQDIALRPLPSVGIRESIAAAGDDDFVVGRLFGALNEGVVELMQEFADATENQTEELESAAAATSDFADTVSGSAATIAQAMAAIDPRYNIQAGGDTTSERARSRFEASAFRIGDPSVINFGGSMMDRSAERLNRSALGPAESGGRNLGTLRLTNDRGDSVEVEGERDNLTKWLADTLSSAAGSVD